MLQKDASMHMLRNPEQARLNSNSQATNLLYKVQVKREELQWCVCEVMDGASIYSLPGSVLGN